MFNMMFDEFGSKMLSFPVLLVVRDVSERCEAERKNFPHCLSKKLWSFPSYDQKTKNCTTSKIKTIQVWVYEAQEHKGLNYSETVHNCIGG